ncbi:hemerythrin domain-containing protein [Sulfolobus sp. E11-6]|uniref:hemerythrin domain-containing protein n=1 Tax=Sulfolobus sp. E11-6 TaxID=2663020 RepID=UPI0012958CB1|nr:hemerythrin domain-containing protein [Sulfolobus sp. E11-6]QGA69132.1 hemerythrin domain-containing protein [Sulfolobus sp. E11-6]
MLNSIKALMDEHNVILKALDVLNVIDAKMDNIQDIKTIINFIKNFVDDCHHVKEEKVLFNFLEQKGMVGGPTYVMVYEHNKLRDLISKIEAEYSEPQNLREDLNNLIMLLASHIDKENNVLFPTAENLISDDEDKVIYNKFEKIEENFGKEKHEKYIELINELYGKYVNKR